MGQINCGPIDLDFMKLVVDAKSSGLKNDRLLRCWFYPFEDILHPRNQFARFKGFGQIVICAQLEADLGEWPPDEAAAYRADVGLERSGLETLAWAGYEVLDLITFFTITGGKVVRAWAIQRGTKAAQAAGKVHTQMEKGFIRAEVMCFDDFSRAGSEEQAREEGLVHVEGKDYSVQDGYIIRVRFH